MTTLVGIVKEIKFNKRDGSQCITVILEVNNADVQIKSSYVFHTQYFHKFEKELIKGKETEELLEITNLSTGQNNIYWITLKSVVNPMKQRNNLKQLHQFTQGVRHKTKEQEKQLQTLSKQQNFQEEEKSSFIPLSLDGLLSMIKIQVQQNFIFAFEISLKNVWHIYSVPEITPKVYTELTNQGAICFQKLVFSKKAIAALVIKRFCLEYLGINTSLQEHQHTLMYALFKRLPSTLFDHESGKVTIYDYFTNIKKITIKEDEELVQVVLNSQKQISLLIPISQCQLQQGEISQTKRLPQIIPHFKKAAQNLMPEINFKLPHFKKMQLPIEKVFQSSEKLTIHIFDYSQHKKRNFEDNFQSLKCDQGQFFYYADINDLIKQLFSFPGDDCPVAYLIIAQQKIPHLEYLYIKYLAQIKNIITQIIIEDNLSNPNQFTFKAAIRQLKNKMIPLKWPAQWNDSIIMGIDTCRNKISMSALLISQGQCSRFNKITLMEEQQLEQASYREIIKDNELKNLLKLVISKYQKLFSSFPRSMCLIRDGIPLEFFLKTEVNCFENFCQTLKEELELEFQLKTYSIMQFKRTPITALMSIKGKLQGGLKGQMHIVEGERYNTVIGSLAQRKETISKPYVFYLIKNKYFELDKMLDLISSLSCLHYNFCNVKQLYSIMQADENVYWQDLFERNNCYEKLRQLKFEALEKTSLYQNGTQLQY